MLFLSYLVQTLPFVAAKEGYNAARTLAGRFVPSGGV